MNIGLLECDHVVGRFPTVDGGYREMFWDLLSPHVPELKLSFYDACHGEVPQSARECDAYICTGSKWSVYDGFPWIATLSAFIRKLQKPYVGICFGHQMLAHALGGEVKKASQGWGAGVLPMKIEKKESWMQPPLDLVQVQYMHQDQVQTLPKGAAVLARAPHCEVAMFRVGESMLGIEGHPEFTVAYGEALIHARSQLMGEERAESALRSLSGPTDSRAVGQWIARFLER